MSINGMLDLFAGSGVGVAAKRLGVREYGVEIMPAAIETRNMAGFETPYNDAWDIEAPGRLGLEFNTLWASPPCQTFSVAGKGGGRKALDEVLQAISDLRYRSISELKVLGSEVGDARTALVLVPLAYIHKFQPTYVALEQVPTVLPVWEACASEMRDMGYSVWTGNLHSEQYGVPQTRKRAFLIARNDGADAEAPVTVGQSTLESIRPDQQGLISGSSTTSGGIRIPGSRLPRSYRSIHQHAFTATSKLTTQRWYPSMEMVSEFEGKLIQSYPEDFRFGGSASDRRLQMGNAVPPLMAEAVLKTFMPENQ